MGENSDELTNFYKGVQQAPDLQSFAQDEDTLDLEQELKKFELVADDFDDLVKSFNSDTQSSESLEFT